MAPGWVCRSAPRAIVLLLAGIAVLGASPQANAQGLTLVSPGPGAQIQAREAGIAFTATGPSGRSGTCPGGAGSLCVHISRSPDQDADGRIGTDAASVALPESTTSPGIYQGSTGPSAPLFLYEPGTYYWQANYFAGGCAPDCYAESGVRTLIITQVPAPSPVSPPSGASVPFGGTLTLAVEDPPFDNAIATTLYIEIARGNRLDGDGTFADADSMFMASPLSAGGGVYEHRFGRPFTEFPGTYYWQALRYDCFAEADCWVTDNEIRSFTVAASTAGGGGGGDPCAGARKNLRQAKRALHRAARAIRRADTAIEIRRAERLLKQAKRRVKRAKKAVKDCR